MVKQIQKLNREKITPVPEVNVNPGTVFGHRIVVVNVRPGEDAPYYTLDSNDVSVRKGASNRKPNPQTELPAVVGDD